MSEETAKIGISDRLRTLWLGIGWLLVILVAWLSLVPIPSSIDVSAGDKAGHMLAYATLMLWFLQPYPAHHRRLLLAIGFVIMGLGLEVIQGLIPSRNLDYVDMAANVGGVAVGWLLGHTPLGSALITIDTRFVRIRAGVVTDRTNRVSGRAQQQSEHGANKQ